MSANDSPPPRRPRRNGLPPPHLIDRLPPHSIEAEQATLGALLLDYKAAEPDCAELLRSDSEVFYDLRHQSIYEHCLKVSERGHPVNTLTVAESLKDANALEPCGGYVYLSALQDVIPVASAASHYARIVAEKAALRRLVRACTNVVSRVYDGEEADVEKVLAQAEQEVMGVRRLSTKRDGDMRDLTHEAVNWCEQMHQNQGKITGLSTGLVDLDKATDGLHGDELIVIAGYPGAGKTALGVNILESLAIDNEMAVGIFSFEMHPRRLVRRMLASRARVNLRNIRDGHLAERDFPKLTTAAGKLINAKIFPVHASGMTIYEVRAKARQMKRQHGIRAWLVDYIQIVEESGKRDTTREREVANISGQLKKMAGEFDDPVIALSQLNEDGKMRESRAIGQDADTVYELRKADEETATELTEGCTVNCVILKQRDGEAPMVVPLTFLKCYTRFECAAKIRPGDMP